MEFIYNSSNPNADTRQRLEDLAESEEEGCQQLVLRLTKATKTSRPQTEMHTNEQVEELVLELAEGWLAVTGCLTATFLTSVGHVLMQGQVSGASVRSLFSRVTCQAPAYMVYIHHSSSIPWFSRPA